MSELRPAPTYFVSDVHWQPAGDAPDPTGPFGRFLRAVGARAVAGASVQLYIIGDLFDFWLERGRTTFPFYAAHVAALEAAATSGVKISLLFGNRDFTYRRALPDRCGVEILGDRAELDLDGKRILLHHGDLFCTADWRYQLYRRFIRSWPLRLLGRLMPLSFATRLIGWMRRQSRAEIERKPNAAMGVIDAAIAAEHERGFQAVLCGHVHRPSRRRVEGGPEGSELITLGAWDDNGGWYVTFADGRFELERFD